MVGVRLIVGVVSITFVTVIGIIIVRVEIGFKFFIVIIIIVCSQSSIFVIRFHSILVILLMYYLFHLFEDYWVADLYWKEMSAFEYSFRYFFTFQWHFYTNSSMKTSTFWYFANKSTIYLSNLNSITTTKYSANFVLIIAIFSSLTKNLITTTADFYYFGSSFAT